jgi:hypothetical protein
MAGQYAFEDFSLRQVAQLLGKTGDVEKYTNASMVRVSSASPVAQLSGVV